MYCPECGTENNEAEYCQQCGKNLNENVQPVTKNGTDKVTCPTCHAHNPAGVKKCKYCGEWIDKSDAPYPHTLATVLGYIFSLLGGWLGLVAAIYLLRTDNEKAKMHGKIMLGIFGIWIILIIIL